jgi:hypothetical protein
MEEIEKLDINKLQELASYLLLNRNQVERVISEFGEVKADNGYGTFFLQPKYSVFKVIWVHEQMDRIESAGFGGEHLGLYLYDLYTFYNQLTEGFSRYDNEYIYVFFSPRNDNYTIKILSKDKLIEREEIINNIEITGFEIILR